MSVQILKDGDVIGAIVIYRPEVGPFADKQIARVKNFASQAVIAIESARQVGELSRELFAKGGNPLTLHMRIQLSPAVIGLDALPAG